MDVIPKSFVSINFEKELGVNLLVTTIPSLIDTLIINLLYESLSFNPKDSIFLASTSVLSLKIRLANSYNLLDETKSVPHSNSFKIVPIDIDKEYNV